ncbi:MAG: diguanylate cyclase, partial [Solobacterium sp.]|nr:diguanylate cyclase [Solobacterium sp.]
DDLAAGVLETFRENNIHVPDDVLISGFDNSDISMRTVPRITTIDRDYEKIGFTALETMKHILKSEKTREKVFSPVRYIFSESCGFTNHSETKEMLTSIYNHMDTALKDFYEMLTKFQPAVLNADSISEILHACETYFPSIGCPDVYLNINDDYLEYEVSTNVTQYSTRSNLMAHFGKPLGFSYDYKHLYKKFDTKNLLPETVEMNRALYMIYPLRQNTICIGYLITEGLSPSLQYGFLNIILTLISSAIESARKKEILQRVNSRLDDLYVHDHLTGLFNRFGLNRFGQIAYEHLLRDFKEAYFIFVDVDDMKHINDQFGHEIGDLALQDAANIIHRATSNENAFAMRYGGDEFLLICRKNLIPKLQDETDSLVRNIKRPYHLSLSMGACKILESDHYTMKQCIEKADEKMYSIKKEKKMHNT